MSISLQKITLFLFLISLLGCDSCKDQIRITNKINDYVQYSVAVKDSFYIQVQVPIEYNDSTHKKYPVAILLDANFHFSMLAASVHQYERAGLLPPIILVGIGYRNFMEMDSLRTRDYLYPAALPSDEMKTAGGGENFRQFIANELLPAVDAKLRTKKEDRSLLGHSFGGYFTLYNLLSQSMDKKQLFKNFVAASPPLWYHAFYLNGLPTRITALNKKDSIKIFLSVGELENSVWDIKPVVNMIQKLKLVNKSATRGIVYNQLGHMDTGQLSFLKGLQEFYH